MKIVNAEKKIVDKLIDECTETIEEVKLAEITIAIGLWLKIIFLALNLILIKEKWIKYIKW